MILKHIDFDETVFWFKTIARRQKIKLSAFESTSVMGGIVFKMRLARQSVVASFIITPGAKEGQSYLGWGFSRPKRPRFPEMGPAFWESLKSDETSGLLRLMEFLGILRTELQAGDKRRREDKRVNLSDMRPGKALTMGELRKLPDGAVVYCKTIELADPRPITRFASGVRIRKDTEDANLWHLDAGSVGSEFYSEASDKTPCVEDYDEGYTSLFKVREKKK